MRYVKIGKSNKIINLEFVTDISYGESNTNPETYQINFCFSEDFDWTLGGFKSTEGIEKFIEPMLNDGRIYNHIPHAFYQECLDYTP